MHVEVVAYLSFLYHLLILKLILYLGHDRDEEAGRGGRYDGVHHDLVRTLVIDGDFERSAGIHKK